MAYNGDGTYGYTTEVQNASTTDLNFEVKLTEGGGESGMMMIWCDKEFDDCDFTDSNDYVSR